MENKTDFIRNLMAIKLSILKGTGGMAHYQTMVNRIDKMLVDLGVSAEELEKQNERFS